MFLKTPINVSSFLIDDVQIVEPSFKDGLTHSKVNKRNLESGYGSGLTVKDALHSSMGEYLERVTQSKPSLIFNEPYLDAYNITNDSIEKVPMEDIYLFDTSILGSNVKSFWNDSSGTAFHTSSLKLIQSSFFEFIERQSLVFNWLTKTPGKTIKLDDFCNFDHIRKLKILLEGYLENINLFNISIHPRIYVVITVGTSEYCKTVGIAASWSLTNAIFSSMKEALQLLSSKIPSHQQSYFKPDMLNRMANVLIPESEEFYISHFENITPEQLKKSYSYLDKSNLQSREQPLLNNPTEENYLSTLEKISKDLSVELMVCFIPSIIQDLPGSVIRIIGKGAFPHIRTDIIEPHLYTVKGINKLSEEDTPNLGKMVPFN